MASRVGLRGARVADNQRCVFEGKPAGDSCAADGAVIWCPEHGGRKILPNRWGWNSQQIVFDAKNALSVRRSRFDRAMAFANPAQGRAARNVLARGDDLDGPTTSLSQWASGEIGAEP